MEEEKKEIVISDDIKKAVYGFFSKDTAEIHNSASRLTILLKDFGAVVIHDKVTNHTVLLPWVKKKEE